MPIGRGHFISSGGVCGHLRPTDVTGQELRQVMVGRHRVVVTVNTPPPLPRTPHGLRTVPLSLRLSRDAYVAVCLLKDLYSRIHVKTPWLAGCDPLRFLLTAVFVANTWARICRN